MNLSALAFLSNLTMPPDSPHCTRSQLAYARIAAGWVHVLLSLCLPAACDPRVGGRTHQQAGRVLGVRLVVREDVLVQPEVAQQATRHEGRGCSHLPGRGRASKADMLDIN